MLILAIDSNGKMNKQYNVRGDNELGTIPNTCYGEIFNGFQYFYTPFKQTAVCCIICQ